MKPKFNVNFKVNKSAGNALKKTSYFKKCKENIFKGVGCFGKPKNPKPLYDYFDTFVAEHAQKMVFDSHYYLLANNPEFMDCKVVAGIVKIVGRYMEVVSLGTGSKFSYDPLYTHTGNTLIDCHAEVIARRGFVRYLFHELEKTVNGEGSIFVKNHRTGLYKIKDGITFHLYVSTAPCGDGRVFSHADTGYCSPAGIPEGFLRTKGERALTVLCDNQNTPKKYNNGAQSMSCSAKIMRWNILGLQGAMLTNFIEPVYLATIILGDKFDEKHLQRALYGRIENRLHSLPEGFRANKPKLIAVNTPIIAKGKKGRSQVFHSCNWFSPTTFVETVDARIGSILMQNQLNLPSRLSKRAIFFDYLRVGAMIYAGNLEMDWVRAKLGSPGYYHAKKRFVEAIYNSNIGSWVDKSYLFNSDNNYIAVKYY